MRELSFYVHASTSAGEDEIFSVYKTGRGYEVSGPNFERHVCHPATTTKRKVLGEITLVFGASIKSTSEPGSAAGAA